MLAIASGGGHWIQLMRLRPAFEGCDIAYVTVEKSYRSQVSQHRFYTVNDATRWSKIGLLRMGFRLAWIIARERPDVIISTGAAPGYFGVRLGRLFRKKTVWIDSMANVEQISLSGQWAAKYADLWLTQWPHLAKTGGPDFKGAVL